MFEDKKLWQLYRDNQGDIVFELHPERFSVSNCIKSVIIILLKVLLPIFAFFDFLAARRKLVISSVGLGIGLGLSVLVTQRPDTLQAFPTIALVSTKPIYAQQLVIPSIDLSASVQPGNVQNIIENALESTLVHDERSSGLGGNFPAVITEVGIENILRNLDRVRIGDTLIVIGSNNGKYLFTVTEIRDMKAEYLPNVVGANGNSVILYKSKNILRTQLYMIIAQPTQ